MSIVTVIAENEYNVSVDSPSVVSVEVALAGAQGIQGPVGVGVPPGGTVGQRLVKVDSTDYYTQWVDQTTTMSNKQVAFVKSGLFSGDADFVFDEDLHAVAIGNGVFLPDNPLGVSGNIDSYLQVNLQNRNAGVDSSSDYVATSDDGSDSGIYADLGICNSGYDSDVWDVTVAHDSYVFGDGGNVVVGTLSVGKKLKFFIANTEHEGHPEDVVMELDQVHGLNMADGYKVKENGFALTDLITECASEAEETAAFAAGSKIVIRTDLL